MVELPRVAEVAGDCLFDFIFLTHQPHHEEKAHHGGHEIRERDFPGASMVTMATMLFLLYDDRLGFVSHGLLLLRFVAGFFQFRESGANLGKQSATGELNRDDARYSFVE